MRKQYNSYIHSMALASRHTHACKTNFFCLNVIIGSRKTKNKHKHNRLKYLTALTYSKIIYRTRQPAVKGLKLRLGTFELGRVNPPTSIEKQAQRNRDVEVEPKDISFNSSAETDSSVEVD